ncbi:DUF3828 domain-containing protein [Duganella rhizosphaerae]|uniref:DUF3828 domain-containing protein n=1 Tax=Duganella rhizosphaerae TaxID=2885763 RepID=UPI00403F7B66
MKTPFCYFRKFQAIAFSVLVALFICWNHALANTSQPAEQTVSAFYEWYLRSLAAGREPLSDDRKEISKYVSRSLVRELEKRMRSDEGMEEDYFIKAQDYLDDWERSVVVDKATVDGEKARAALQLGATGESRRRFSIALVREGGIWKIRSVQLLNVVR